MASRASRGSEYRAIVLFAVAVSRDYGDDKKMASWA